MRPDAPRETSLRAAIALAGLGMVAWCLILSVLLD